MKSSPFPAAVLALFAFCLAAQPARADLEVLQLQYRDAAELLPILRPLVEPGGALTGMRNQLVLRASAANIAEIRRVLASIDTLPRRLMISVRQDADASAAARGAAVSGSVSAGSPGAGASVTARTYDTRRIGEDRVVQTLQVMDGGVATIQVGQSLPVPGRVVTRTVNGVVVQDTLAFRDVGTGFQVVPRVSGERVTLDIRPHRDTPGPGGTVNIQGASTTLSGRLGEWIALGGIDTSASESGSGTLSGASTRRSDNRSIWVKVEELR